MITLTQEMGESVLYESTQENAVWHRGRKAPTEVGIN